MNSSEGGERFAQFADRARAKTRTFAYRAESTDAGPSGWTEAFPDLDSPDTLVVVFAADRFYSERGPIDELRAAFPQSVFVGCGASQVVYNGSQTADHITVGVIKFASTSITSSLAEFDDSADSRDAGKELAQGLIDPSLRGVLVYTKGLDVDATELVRGMQEVLPSGIPVSGGLASNRAMDECWVFAGDGQPTTNAVCAVGLIGDNVELVCSAGGGWTPTSDHYTATKTSKADGHKILEIDRRRAYDVLAELDMVDDVEGEPWSLSMSARSIALKLDGVDVMRSIVSSDPDEGSIQVAGDIDEGLRIQFMKSTVSELLDGIDEAAHGIRMKTVGLTEDALCVAIGCMGRVSIMGERSSDEPALLQAALGDDIGQVGMCSYGEILTTSSGPPQIYNMTLNVAVIREH